MSLTAVLAGLAIPFVAYLLAKIGLSDAFEIDALGRTWKFHAWPIFAHRRVAVTQSEISVSIIGSHAGLSSAVAFATVVYVQVLTLNQQMHIASTSEYDISVAAATSVKFEATVP